MDRARCMWSKTIRWKAKGAAGIQRLAVARARARMMQVCSSAGLGAPVELRVTWQNMNALSVNYRCADK